MTEFYTVWLIFKISISRKNSINLFSIYSPIFQFENCVTCRHTVFSLFCSKCFLNKALDWLLKQQQLIKCSVYKPVCESHYKLTFELRNELGNLVRNIRKVCLNRLYKIIFSCIPFWRFFSVLKV